MSDLRSTYNRIAEDWFRDHQDDDWWINGTNKFISFLKPRGLVLDVGCGAGIKSRYLINKGLKVVGIDLSDKMIEIAKREVSEAEFQVADISEPLKFREGFDGIFAQAVLLHIPKKEVRQVLNNLIGTLKQGGYFYIAVKGIKEGQPEEQIIKENDYGYEYERFFSFYSQDEVNNHLKDLGMNIVFNEIVST